MTQILGIARVSGYNSRKISLPLVPGGDNTGEFQEAGQLAQKRTLCNAISYYCVARCDRNGLPCGGAIVSDQSKQVLRLKDIPTGREGWVYLIHAVGTSRYKVGRSVNPVARHQTLQNQSPYPLKIVECFWTVDAPTDEAGWHKQLSEYRVYGEWFELIDKEAKAHLNGFCTGSAVGVDISGGWLQDFLEKLLVEDTRRRINHKFTESGIFRLYDLFSTVYEATTGRQQLEQLTSFLTVVAPEKTKAYFYGFEEVRFEELHCYVTGLIEAFALLVLKKEWL
jgi:hypothetical protein